MKYFLIHIYIYIYELQLIVEACITQDQMDANNNNNNNNDNNNNIDLNDKKRKLSNYDIEKIQLSKKRKISNYDQQLYCICRKKYNNEPMIQCDGTCNDWYHIKCIGISQNEFDDITMNESPWLCPLCLTL